MSHAASRLVPLLLVAAAAGAQQPPPAPVVAARVVRQEVTARRPFVGTVEPVRASTVGTELEGLVEELLVHEGERIGEGQPLVKLRTRQIEVRLAAARALLLQRREELAELENGSRPEEIAQARARVGQAEAEVEYRKWKLDRTRQLRASDGTSEDDLQEATLAARRAQDRLAEEKALLALVEAGPRAERVAQARATVQAQEAEVARLEDDQARHTVKAPFAGYVTLERTEVGEWLAKGAPVADMMALDEVEVTIPVLEDYVVSLRVGAPVDIVVDALPGTSWKGTIHAIVPQADRQGRTFPVKIRVANRDEGGSVALKAGMFARAQIDVGEKVQATLVHKDAVVLGGPQPIVYVIDAQSSTVRPAPVHLGVAVGDLVEVRGPLVPGDQIVVRGNERLRPGQPVVVTEERGS